MPQCHTCSPRPALLRVLVLATVSAVSVMPAQASALACPGTDMGRVTSTADGLKVEESAVPVLRSGDILIQLNSHRLHSCTNLTDGLSEAQRNQLVPLFLIRRDNGMQVVLVEPAHVPAGPAAPQSQPAAEVAIVLPTAIPPSAVPTTHPTPLTPADADAARQLLDQLVAFGRDLQARQPLPMSQPWVQRVDGLRQQYKAEQARNSSVTVVEPILTYYEAVADILKYKETATRERRNVRARAEVVLEYQTNSAVGEWLHRYPFLRASVIKEPETIHFIMEGEVSGLWAPDRAVALLLDRAVSEGSALSGKLTRLGS
jgi:hypothetical protein